MKKKRKKNPKRYRILIAIAILLVIIYWMISLLFSHREDNPVVFKEDLSPTTNFVESMNYTDEGIEVTGVMKQNNGTYSLNLCKVGTDNCQKNSAENLKKDRFKGDIKLTDLENGDYEVIIESGKKEKLTDTREAIERIARAHIGNKLITIDYSNNRVKLKVENFQYEYDILIDPGHGGTDSGSFNKYMDEEKLNLEQSLYEKKRYEEHGLKVKMIREDHTYGIQMGEEDWSNIRQRAYAIGYYSVVSRISYSNHHNSSEIKGYSGWEIIVPSRVDSKELSVEKEIASAWEKKYKLRDTHMRFYARDAEDGELFSRRNKEQYQFSDYYAVIRMPYELFRQKHILYEGCYLSNSLDYDWYYNKDNWKKLSEEKIKVYVESLGKEYIPPKK